MSASLLFAVFHLLGGTVFTTSSSLPLSSLLSPCHVVTVMAEHLGYPHLRMNVDCGCRPVRIAGPESLEGLVEIKTAAAALEYVRFFSSERTYTLVNFGELVEIAGFGTARVTADGRYLVSEDYRRIFGAVFHAAAVTEEKSHGAGPRSFRIRRVAVSTDGRICDIEEFVGGNGSYALLSRTVLVENASKIGILHLGEI